jgi:predicted nuclease of predicted toxin-antitoxin system
VKLLFDESLSPRLVDSLSDLYPDSSHVHERGLGSATDEAVWENAKKQGLTIVSKDSDFEARSIFLGAPPKFIWIHARNCATHQVEQLLRTTFATVKRFVEEDDEACLILGSHRSPK